MHPGLTNPPGLLLTNHPGLYIAGPGGPLAVAGEMCPGSPTRTDLTSSVSSLSLDSNKMQIYRCLISSSSSNDRGQSSFNNLDKARSAKSFPSVWQVGQ